ncbi:PREDICTED: heat shock protein 23-like [Rhagoletis zephyria]|uniref:heat shock protein 23-like n=1 Tax=Rhagoletis zephyria TaxID=28612 RepID=UPI000811A93B|nr:PREDICTED: heat shock protein 23-like [Rhagoletis zephyria]
MSSLPILLNLIDELDNPLYYGNDFGLGLHPHHIHRHRRHNEPAASNLLGYTLPLSLVNRLGERPLSRRGRQGEGKLSVVGKDGLQVCMDVAQFKPSELSVKVVDNSIVVEGKHEEREDEHGYISRHFVRRYALPKGYNADNVISTLSSDGVLTVSAPKPQEEASNERVVQIQQTGPAHLNVKQNAEEKIGDANGEAEKK